MEKEIKVRCRECDHPFDTRFEIQAPMDYAFCPYCQKIVEINTSLWGQLKPKHVLKKRKKDKKDKGWKEFVEKKAKEDKIKKDKIKEDKEKEDKEKEDKDKDK